MRLALISLNIEWENKQKNKLKVLDICKSFCKKNVDLVIFPEMSLTGFSMNTSNLAEDEDKSDTIGFFVNLAKEYSINIAFGIILKSNNKATNNLIVINRQGIVSGNYAKIHPFSYSGEDNFFEKGNEAVICNIDGIKCGLSICYDLRFPELFQQLSSGAELIINIANWPKKRVEHWLTLLRARAIENQVFFIGVNRIGIDGNDFEYEKSSVVFSPEGNVTKSIQYGDEVDIVDINIDEVKQYRLSFPMKKDRRVNLYREFYETEG
jgi:omega-amidase